MTIGVVHGCGIVVNGCGMGYRSGSRVWHGL